MKQAGRFVSFYAINALPSFASHLLEVADKSRAINLMRVSLRQLST